MDVYKGEGLAWKREKCTYGRMTLFLSNFSTSFSICTTFLGCSEPYLLSAGELELGSSERLDRVVLVHVLAADTDHHLPDLDTRHLARGLAEGVTHTLSRKGVRGGRKGGGGERRWIQSAWVVFGKGQDEKEDAQN